jgi:hypothetical protein
MRAVRAIGDDAGMTTHPPSTAQRRPRPRRAFLLGFLAGVLVIVPAAMLALLFPVAERVAPVLTPGLALLRPLSSAMAGWPGGVNLLLGSLANGLVVGLLVAAVALVVGRGR